MISKMAVPESPPPAAACRGQAVPGRRQFDHRNAELPRAHSWALAAAVEWGLRGADAEDVASAALLNSLTRWDRFQCEGRNARRRWMVTIARNMMRDRHRRAQVRVAASRTALAVEVELREGSAPPMPDRVLEIMEAKSRRDGLLAALPEDLRAHVHVVARVSAAELSRSEGAARLGLTVSAYDKFAQRVKRAIREAAEAEHVSSSSLFVDCGDAAA